jgi:hypothetical protein
MTTEKTTKTRKPAAVKLAEGATLAVPKVAQSFAKVTALLKYNPTPAQKEQIVKTVRSYFEQFELAYTAPAKTTAPGTFNLVS